MIAPSREQIVADHQWLVQVIARKHRSPWEPLEDLEQVCNVGLLEALERFDPAFGVPFKSFAEATMRGVLRHHFRTAWRVQIPRRIQELHLALGRLRGELTVELRRTPTIAELAERAGTTTSAVIEALVAGSAPSSLTHVDDTDDGLIAQADVVDVDGRVDTLAMLAKLSWRERRVLYLRYFLDHTQTEVAATLGLSQVTVSRAEREGMRQLRRLAA